MSKKLPILIVAAHSSTYVPPEIRKNMLLSDHDIEAQSDLYTGQIFNNPDAHFLPGEVSRLVSDYNRSPEHIEMEHLLAHDGVVVSVNEDGRPIYKDPPTLEAIEGRIEKYHHPFHAKIEEVKPEVKFLIDGHSLRSTGPETKNDSGQERADIVLGNRDYTSCTRNITHKVAEFFLEQGYSIKINNPYEGKYILGHHCSRIGLNGLQIEFNRKLYMNEESLVPFPDKILKLNQ